MSNQDVRFLYMRDTRSDRVITVARTFNKEERVVEFSYSVNHPSIKNQYGMKVFSGDNFSKTRGRHIAVERLNQGKKFVVKLQEGQRPIEAIAMCLGYAMDEEDSIPRCVRRIARDFYLSMNDTIEFTPEDESLSYNEP